MITNVVNALTGIGNINVGGDFTFIAPDILICAPINAGGNIVLGADGTVTAINPTGVTTNTITQLSTAPDTGVVAGDVALNPTTGGGITLTTNTLNVNDNFTANDLGGANAGTIVVQDSTPADGLTVNITSAVPNQARFETFGARGDISFNAGTNAAITMNALPGEGSIVANGGANNVFFQGGAAGDVNVNINDIAGCVQGTGNLFSVQVDTGNLTAGNITATSDITLNTTAAGGDFATCGTILSNTGNVSDHPLVMVPANDSNVAINGWSQYNRHSWKR